MKIKAFLILASVLLALVSTSLSAEENITGAFGLKLGQTLSSQMIKTSELKFTYESDDTYSFSPEKKFRSFSTYTIKITPKTRKIYSISATESRDEHDDSTCEKEQALIMAIMKKKYWEIEQQYSSMSEPKKKYGGIDLSPAYGAGSDLLDQPESLWLGDIGAAQAGARLDQAYAEDSNAFLQAEQFSRNTGLSLTSAISLYGKKVINQDNRSVAIQCGGIYDAPLKIVYLDSKLAELAENARIAAENERIALERSKVIIEVIMFILSIIFFAISAIIFWRVDREKCKSLKTYLAKILIGVSAFSVSIACLIETGEEELIKFILSIMFFTIGAIICWRVDREKCKSLKIYLAKITAVP